MILHIDMDAFFASIEQAANPRLKGRPLIVGSRNSRFHTVVCAASYEAKAYGINSGMPSAEAFRLCPDLEFVAAEQGKYIWTSEEILNDLKKYGFSTGYASIDEFQMDIADEPAQALAESIQQQIQEEFRITASIGIAKNCLLAKLASKINKPRGITTITETNLREILERTPAEKLCGVGEKTNQILQNAGIKTCLEIYLKTPAFLQGLLGKSGLNLYTALHAKESFNEENETSLPKSIGHSYTLPMAVKTPRFIQAWIRLLSEMVSQRLRQDNLTANTVNLWLNGPEIGNLCHQRTFQQATDDGYEINQRCLKIMANLAQKTPKIRALGVTCGNLQKTQYSPLFKEEQKRRGLLEAMDKINLRHGEGTIYPAVISFSQKINRV